MNYYYFSFQTPPDKLSVSAFSDMISNNINIANNILILPAIIYIYIYLYIYIYIYIYYNYSRSGKSLSHSPEGEEKKMKKNGGKLKVRAVLGSDV